MADSTNDILNPVSLVIPKATTAVIDTLICEVGTLMFDTTKGKLSVCITKAAGAASWEDVTSA